MARQIVLDTETTGIHLEEGHRIIEIGCVELLDRRVTQNKYHCYLNPQRDIDAGAKAVHGLSSAFLADKPLFSDIVPEFISFVEGAELIIHNAPFDLGFINNELLLCSTEWKPLTHYCRILDTLALARKLHAGQRNNLDALCKRYGVDNKHREYHGALLDAYLLAQVYLSMTEGQKSLLDELDRGNQAGFESTRAKINKMRQKKVIKVAGEEERLHEEYLQNMIKQGKCLWLEGRDG